MDPVTFAHILTEEREAFLEFAGACTDFLAEKVPPQAVDMAKEKVNAAIARTMEALRELTGVDVESKPH